MIDTHCHLTFPEYAGVVSQVLDRAAEAGVTGAITISTTTQDCLSALEVARAHPGRVWCSAGVHPLYSDKGPHQWANLARVALDASCVAWGELGLDRHYDRPPFDLQRTVLDEQLAFIRTCRDEGFEGRKIDLPVVVHCREAFADLLPVLAGSGLAANRFVFHCFTGNADEARRVLDFGAMISFTGVVTYPNAPEVREACQLVPPDRLMIETDAPFLTPHPHRGVRPNEPKFARITAEAVATLRGEPWEELHQQINRNTRAFFGVG